MDAMLHKAVVLKEDTAYIDFLKVLLTVGIIFRHAAPDFSAGTPLLGAVCKGIVLFTEICVPLFFAISGYLFFLNAPRKPEVKWFGSKLKKRVFSLLLPYLIANAVAFLCYWSVIRFKPDWIAGFLGDNWKDPLFVLWTGPINMSLWFIRELIIVSILSPLVWLIVRYTKYWGVLALGLLWFFGKGPAPIFFFSLGACLSFRGHGAADSVRHAGPYFLLTYACCFVLAMNADNLLKTTVLLGLPMAVWTASAFLKKVRFRHGPELRAWCFFLYLYHYIPLTGLKKFAYSSLGTSSTAVGLLKYFAVALGLLSVLTLICHMFRKCMPKLSGIILGGK